MTVGLAMAWPGMPAGKVGQLHGDGLLDIRRKIIPNVLDDPADNPCSRFRPLHRQTRHWPLQPRHRLMRQKRERTRS